MKVKFLLLLTFALFIVAGCSGGGNPLIPSDNDNQSTLTGAAPDSLVYPHFISNAESGAGAGVFGMYSLHLDASTLKAELVPVRNTDLGAVYETDITSFLGSLCADCLQVVGVSLTEENFLEVTFKLHHPIPVPDNPFEPKPGDRLDLHLFDVRGIIITEGNRKFTGMKADVDGDGNITEELICNPTLLNNADGYTTFFDKYMDTNGVPTTANLHPYKLFFKDPKPGNYQPTVNPINGWITLAYPQGQNVFPQGDLGYNASYIFDMEQGKDLDLVLLLDACYGHTAQFAIPYPEIGSRMNPRYFLPEFHRKEAWLAYTNITNNNLAYNDPYGTATLTVTIYDWQAGLTGAGTMNYFTSNLTHLTNTSDVTEVAVFVPELVSEPVTQYINKAGLGTWASPYVYTYTIENKLNAAGGTYFGIVAVKDTVADTNLGPIGVDRKLGTVSIKDFKNYQIFPIDVSAVAANQPPLAIFITDPFPAEINSGDFVTFDATMCMDPDGEIILYEWDFEFEGLDFVTDAEGATPPPRQYFNPNPAYPSLFFALLRVTDNGDPPMQNMFGTEVIVMPNSPPIPVIKVTPGTTFSECDLVTLDGSDSHDDTQIVTYEWDLNYDPSVPEFNVDATGPVVKRRFSPGACNVMLRVWDDSAISGVTRARLVSQPLDGNPREVAFCDNYILDEQDSYNSNTFAGGGQKNIVLLPNWSVAALWVDENGPSGGPAIKCSLSTDGGRTFNPAVNVNSESITGGLQDLHPSISCNSIGIIHVGYSDGDGTYYFHQSSDGVNFTDRLAVGTGSRLYGGPSITADSLGNIYYFFTGEPITGNVPLKLTQSINGGNSFNSPITLSSDGRFPAAASSAYGNCAITYEGKNVPLLDNSDILVSYQRAGTTFYPALRVVDSSVNDGRSTNPTISISNNNTVYIAWQDSRFGDTDNDYDIFYAYSYSGLGFGENIRVNNTSESTGSQILQDHPALGIDALGRPFIVWRDYRDGVGGDIYFAFSLMPGEPINGNERINDDTLAPPNITQGPPSIIVSPNSGILIMWADERNSASDLGTPLSGPADIYYTFGKLF